MADRRILKWLLQKFCIQEQEIHRLSILKIQLPTQILYSENDTLIDCDMIEHLACRFRCSLTVMENGEHWSHTQEQLEVMQKWVG